MNYQYPRRADIYGVCLFFAWALFPIFPGGYWVYPFPVFFRVGIISPIFLVRIFGYRVSAACRLFALLPLCNHETVPPVYYALHVLCGM